MTELLDPSRQRGGAIANLVALLFVAALCALLYFLRYPILRAAAESWVVDQPAAHADALVVLGDDNFFADRATHAVELLREGVASEVVVSGRKLRPHAGISELMEHDLIERGIPKEKIVRLVQDTDSSSEEAAAIGKLAEERNWKSVVLVTSNYDARRIRYVYTRVFPEGIGVSVAGARDLDFDPERWWEKRKSIRLLVSEIAGTAEAMWELRGTAKGRQ